MIRRSPNTTNGTSTNKRKMFFIIEIRCYHNLYVEIQKKRLVKIWISGPVLRHSKRAFNAPSLHSLSMIVRSKFKDYSPNDVL